QHHFLHGSNVVSRVYGIFKVADLRPAGGDIFNIKSFFRIEAGTQAALPANLADPAATDLEQAGSLFTGFAAQVHHQRADQLGLELLEHLRRDQPFGHAGAAGRGDGVDEDVVLAAFDGQGASETVEAELGHAVVGLTEVAVDARGGG